MVFALSQIKLSFQFLLQFKHCFCLLDYHLSKFKHFKFVNILRFSLLVSQTDFLRSLLEVMTKDVKNHEHFVPHSEYSTILNPYDIF